MRKGAFKTSKKLLINSAKTSGLSFKFIDALYLFWIGNTLFYKGIPVKQFPKLILSRTKREKLRRLVDIRPDIIAINSNCCYELSRSKLRAHIELEEHGIRQPKFIARTWQHGDSYESVKEQLGDKFIMKNVYGYQGKQVFLVSNEKEFCKALRKCKRKETMYQEFIEYSSGRDVRSIVIGDKVVATFMRESFNGDFRANLSQGGKATPFQLTSEQEWLALQICKILKGEFLSVDFLLTQDGELVFCEINLHTQYSLTKRLLDIDVGDILMEYIKDRLGRGQ